MGFPMALIGIRSEIALEKITCNVLNNKSSVTVQVSSFMYEKYT